MRLRVMTYNIRSGRNHAEGLEAVARLIEAQQPDVLGLQELDERMARTGLLPQVDWLTRRLRMRGIFAPAMEYDGGQYGIALLAREPIAAHERRLLFKPQYSDADTRPRHDSEQRVMLGARLMRQSQPLKVIVTHLGLTPDQRTVQVQQLAEFACSWQGALPTIVMGDFNCDPDAPELAPLRAHFAEACALGGVQGEERFTFPSGPLGARCDDGWRGAIDYVWLSPHWQVVAAKVVKDETRASDHQPLVVDLQLTA